MRITRDDRLSKIGIPSVVALVNEFVHKHGSPNGATNRRMSEIDYPYSIALFDEIIWTYIGVINAHFSQCVQNSTYCIIQVFGCIFILVAIHIRDT